MQRRTFLQGGAAALPALATLPATAAALAAFPVPAAAIAPTEQATPVDPPAIELPKPRIQGGLPLMEALANRRTNRNIAARELSAQQLSDLLWAAFGQNRPGSGFRTAPSAIAVREIDIYVFLRQGVYVYDAAAQALRPVVGGNYRARTGTQAGVGQAPVSLLYVADMDKYTARAGALKITDPALQAAFSNAHAGFIGQNVYLYAAAFGLASWFRAMVEHVELGKLLKLRPAQQILYAQGVGYPA
jgi:hypothetical protein